MANYHFQLHYKTGRTNIDADALSRIPWDHTLNSETVKAITNITQSTVIPTFKAYVESAIHFYQVEVKTHPTKMTLEQCVKEQLEDPHIQDWIMTF